MKKTAETGMGEQINQDLGETEAREKAFLRCQTNRLSLKKAFNIIVLLLRVTNAEIEEWHSMYTKDKKKARRKMYLFQSFKDLIKVNTYSNLF